MTTNRDLLDRAVEIYNVGDLEGYVDLYTDDAVLTTPESTFKGRGEIRERFAREMAAFSDISFVLVSYVEQGDLFADEFVFAGTHTGPFVLPDGTTLAPTNNRVELRGMEMVQVRDGKMIMDNLYYDNASAFIQLGLVPGPPPT
jgi:hypothetical protein